MTRRNSPAPAPAPLRARPLASLALALGLLLSGLWLARPALAAEAVVADALSVQFGTTPVGWTSTATVTFSNNWGLPIPITWIGTNPANPEITVTGGTCAAPGSLAALGSCTVNVSFAPTSVGSSSDTLTFQTSVATLNIPLSGQAVSGLSANAALVDFGSVLVGSTATKTVTFSSVAGLALPITWIGTNPANPAMAVTGGTCAAPGSLAPWGSCTVNVSFAPTSVGSSSDTLTFQTSVATLNIPLSGQGLAVPVLCAPGTYSMTGFAPCFPAHAGNYAAGPGATSETPCAPGSFSAQPGQASCYPAHAGSYVDSSGATAETPCPAGMTSDAGATSCTPMVTTFTAAPTRLSFGPILRGVTSPMQLVTFTNTGSSAQTLTGVFFSATPGGPAVAGPFAAVPDPAPSACSVGLVVQPGASCNVRVVFMSPTPGTFMGALTVKVGTPVSVLLRGMATNP